jgi:hypothetical protein
MTPFCGDVSEDRGFCNCVFTVPGPAHVVREKRGRGVCNGGIAGNPTLRYYIPTLQEQGRPQHPERSISNLTLHLGLTTPFSCPYRSIDPPNDRPLRTLLNFRDRTPSALTALPSSTSYNILLIDFAPEIDCDQTAMGLPPVTSAVLLLAK